MSDKITVQELGNLGGKALTDFIKKLPDEDVQLLSELPPRLVAEIFQAGCLFGLDQAIKINKP